MLEGLEISEVNFQETLTNKDFRTDSDFWTKAPKQNHNLAYAAIGSILTTSQYGISIEMNEDGVGYPIYRMNEIHNMLCDFDVNKCANIGTDEFNLFSLNDRDVLFNRTNSFEWVGRTGLFRKQEGKDFVFASYLVRFVPDEKKILPEYLVAFLSSRYGIWDIRRRARHSINQTNVNPEEVKAIQIPLLSNDIQKRIKTCFDLATENLLAAERQYANADTLLLDALNLADFSPSTENTNIKSFHESFAASGRLDAEHYQPKFDELEAKLAATHELVSLKSLLTVNQRGTQPDYGYEGLPVINSKHVREGEVILSDNRLAMAPDKDDALIIKNGDVLINGTGVGTIGRSAPYLHTQNAIPDNHVTVLRTGKVNPIFLSVYLNSIAGKYQVDKYFKGSSGQIELYPKDIDCFYVPVVDESIQTEIESLVKKSYTLKAESTRLLDTAKLAVEIAIEQDEAAALTYVEEQSKA